MQTGNEYAPVAVLLGGLFVVAVSLRWNTVAFEPVALSLTFAFQLMLAGTVIAVLRNEVGMSTFGVFGPAILAFSWLEIGPFWGLLLISYVFVVAATARVAVSGFDLGTAHRLATLLVVACIAVFVMDSVGRLQGIPPLRTALLVPVVLTVWYAERFVGSLEATGWAPATRRLSVTLFAIAAAFAVAARFGTAAERVARATAWAAADWREPPAPDATALRVEVSA